MRVLVADDHQIFRQGLKALLESYPDFEVIAEATDGRQAVEMARQSNPDVIVMDVAMPDLNGIEATRKIMTDQPGTKIVALSMHTDPRFTSEMLRAGAKAYVPKESAFTELAEAVRSVAAGNVYVSPRVASATAAAVSTENGTKSAFRRLSPREREVLQLMAEGLATKEVAAELNVSVKTIETQRRQIMEKLQLFSVAELTKYAIREGLTTVDA
jgi:DNA-binding NarL/FixJ family response regulator